MITAIVLAAGESKRTGAVNKLLLPFAGVTLIDHVVRTVCRSDAAEVIVVLGHEADQVRAVLDKHPVSFAYNPRYPEGMTTSIQAGVEAASPEARGFMICLSDLPRIAPAELNRLIAAFEDAAQTQAAPIIVPVFERQRGNPVLFAASYRAALLAHEDRQGCKRIVAQNADAVVEVAMKTPHVLRDIDTMEAYQRLVAQNRREGPR